MTTGIPSLVIGSHVVITGSFNFTRAAEEHDAGNIMVIDDALALAAVSYGLSIAPFPK